MCISAHMSVLSSISELFSHDILDDDLVHVVGCCSLILSGNPIASRGGKALAAVLMAFRAAGCQVVQGCGASALLGIPSRQWMNEYTAHTQIS